MDVGAPFVPDHQTAEAMQPREITLGDPAIPAQAFVRLDPFTCDAWRDPAGTETSNVGSRAVSKVCVQLAGSAPRSTLTTSDWNDAVDHHEQSDHIRHVRRSESRRCERQPVAIHYDMMLGARFTAVCRVLARLCTPLLAGVCPESTEARDQSIAPARWSRSSRDRWTFSQTPALCQSRSRFQQVIPEHPSSCGRSSHGMPVRRTKTMPVRAMRSGVRGRPRRGRCGGAGMCGAKMVHSSSSMRRRAMPTLQRGTWACCQRKSAPLANKFRRSKAKVFGSEGHYSTARTEVDLGILLFEMGEAQRALELLRDAHQKFLAQLGPAHTQTRQLAVLLQKICS